MGQEQDSLMGMYDKKQALDGMIDELRIWSYVRSDEQVATNYRLSIDPLEDDLPTVYWRMDNDPADCPFQCASTSDQCVEDIGE